MHKVEKKNKRPQFSISWSSETKIESQRGLFFFSPHNLQTSVKPFVGSGSDVSQALCSVSGDKTTQWY